MNLLARTKRRRIVGRKKKGPRGPGRKEARKMGKEIEKQLERTNCGKETLVKEYSKIARNICTMHPPPPSKGLSSGQVNTGIKKK